MKTPILHSSHSRLHVADGRAARNNWWQRSELLALLSAGLALVSWLPQAGAATGTAPVTSPTGGFGIEGDLQANTPTNGIGDWVPGPAGPGGNVLTSAGVPLNSSTTIHVIDLFNNNADDNFGGGDKVNDDPNTLGLGPQSGRRQGRHQSRCASPHDGHQRSPMDSGFR